MVGRLYRTGTVAHDGQLTGQWVFWHGHSATEVGLLNMGDSHGGIDTCVVNYLTRLNQPGSIAWHCTSDPSRNQYVISLDSFLELATFRVLAGRARLFVPDFAKELQFWSPPKLWLSKYDLHPFNRDPRISSNPDEGYVAAKERQQQAREENQPRLL